MSSPYDCVQFECMWCLLIWHFWTSDYALSDALNKAGYFVRFGFVSFITLTVYNESPVFYILWYTEKTVRAAPMSTFPFYIYSTSVGRRIQNQLFLFICLLFCFCGSRDWTQGLMSPWQILHNKIAFPALLILILTLAKLSRLALDPLCSSDWPSKASASWVAIIMGTHPWAWQEHRIWNQKLV